jgi:hypothetical protein
MPSRSKSPGISITNNNKTNRPPKSSTTKSTINDDDDDSDYDSDDSFDITNTTTSTTNNNKPPSTQKNKNKQRIPSSSTNPPSNQQQINPTKKFPFLIFIEMIIILYFLIVEIKIHLRSGFPSLDLVLAFPTSYTSDYNKFITKWDETAPIVKRYSWFSPIQIQRNWGFPLSFNNTYEIVFFSKSNPCGCEKVETYLKGNPITCSLLPHCLQSASTITRSTFHPVLWPTLIAIPYNAPSLHIFTSTSSHAVLFVILDSTTNAWCNLTSNNNNNSLYYSGPVHKNTIIRAPYKSQFQCNHNNSPLLVLELADPTPRWTRGQFLLDVIDRIGNLISRSVIDHVHFDNDFTKAILLCPPQDGTELLSFWKSFVRNAAEFVAQQVNYPQGFFDSTVSYRDPILQFTTRIAPNFEKILLGSTTAGLSDLCVMKASLALIHGKPSVDGEQFSWHYRVLEAAVDARNKLSQDVQKSVAFDGSTSITTTTTTRKTTIQPPPNSMKQNNNILSLDDNQQYQNSIWNIIVTNIFVGFRVTTSNHNDIIWDKMSTIKI